MGHVTGSDVETTTVEHDEDVEFGRRKLGAADAVDCWGSERGLNRPCQRDSRLDERVVYVGE